MRAVPRVLLSLLGNPLLERIQERRYHIEFVGIESWLVCATALMLPILLQRWQICELVPFNLADFLPCLRFEVRVSGYSSENI